LSRSSWQAAVGAIDTSFGGNGIVVVPIGTGDDSGWAVAMQSDGKIVVGGDTYMGPGDFDHAVVRLTTTGSLDTSFNTTGIATANYGGGAAFGRGIAVQTDGKILLSGEYNGGNFDVALSRFTTNGALDTSFNTTGRVTTPIGGSHDYGESVVVQPDGKILVGGRIDNGASDFSVVRYTSAGALDTSFNGTGYVTSPIGAGFDYGHSLALQPDGKVLLAGEVIVGANWNCAVARYTAAGVLDTSFNGTGFVTTSVGASSAYCSSVALQPDGKIILGGAADNGANYDFALIRYTSSGALDTSFNGTGILMSPISAGTDYGYYLALQPDGKIILAGSANFGTNSFTVARYTSSGALDTSFNTTGFISTPIGANDQPLGVVLQSDGKIVLAGRTHNGTNYDIAIVRYR
jgi:uncharacterized delta-60 repeat protein